MKLSWIEIQFGLYFGYSYRFFLGYGSLEVQNPMWSHAESANTDLSKSDKMYLDQLYYVFAGFLLLQFLFVLVSFWKY